MLAVLLDSAVASVSGGVSETVLTTAAYTEEGMFTQSLLQPSCDDVTLEPC